MEVRKVNISLAMEKIQLLKYSPPIITAIKMTPLESIDLCFALKLIISSVSIIIGLIYHKKNFTP